MAEEGKEQEEQEIEQDATGAETESEAAEKTAPEGATGEQEASDEVEEVGGRKPAAVKPKEKTPEEKERDRQGFKEREAKRRRERELEIENARLKGRLEAVEMLGKPEQKPQTKEPEALKRPVRSEYENDEAYEDAIVAFTTETARREIRAERAREAQQAEIRAAHQQHAAKVETIIDAGRKEFEDFDDITSAENLALTPAMQQAIVEAGEMAHKVEYHLGKNPDEADRIRKLPPIQQVKAIVALEIKLKAAPATKKTSTPPPLTTVKGAAAAERKAKDLTDDEYFAKEEAAKRERRATFSIGRR